MKKKQTSPAKDIIEIGKRLHTKGFVASNDGNISVRIGADRFLITPSGVSKGFMTVRSLLVIDGDGNVIRGRGKPSSESQMHLEVYRARPDVHGICHAHPPYATGFAAAGMPLDFYVLPEAVITLGKIPLVPYRTPGTKKFHEPLIPLLPSYDAFLLANHGVLTLGATALDAYYKMETVEHFAHIVFVARQLGRVNQLDAAQVEKLVALRRAFGIRPDIGNVISGTSDSNPEQQKDDTFE